MVHYPFYWKISSNLLYYNILSGKVITDCKCQEFTLGGLNTESIANLIALLRAEGINWSNTGHPVSIQGFVLTYISHGL